MNKKIKFLLCLLLPLFSYGQSVFIPDLNKFPTASIDMAKANAPVSYMNESEEKAVFYMSLVRMEPQIFLEDILKPYISFHKVETNSYVKSLYRELQRAKPVGPLKMDEDLFAMASAHATDIGEKGLTGHTGSRGKTFEKRSSTVLPNYRSMGENIGLGYKSALDNVIGLLIDEGVKNLGHRKAILNTDYNSVGVALESHKNYIYGCVMDFGETKIN